MWPLRPWLWKTGDMHEINGNFVVPGLANMLPTVKMNETKLEINENYEEADLSDVEDDVFVRGGGRNGYRLEYDTAKKPLMTPRKKHV